MNNAIDDLKALHISNLTIIKELNARVEQLESERNTQNILSHNTIRELNIQVEQLESEKNTQNTLNLDTIKLLNDQIEQLKSDKNSQTSTNLNATKELNHRIEQLGSEKSTQFLQWATGIITIVDTFEKMKKAISKKALNKTNKGKKILDRYKKARKSLQELLLQFEITKITFPDNQLIQGFCKVVGTETDAEKPDDTILLIVKNGYIRGTEVIREAEVIVVKNEVIQSDE